MSRTADLEILEVTDESTFDRLPPCADPRFDHRSCDYWEDEVRGSKAARASWWQVAPQAPRPKPQPRSDNPFAPPAREPSGLNPFAPGFDGETTAAFNPFAPDVDIDRNPVPSGAPAKLRLLDRGLAVFGSYAKILVVAGESVAYAQFGPLSAYPRAQHVRELYPRLPSSPLPAVITCVATTTAARGQGLAHVLVEDIVDDLERRGFAAIEAYPDLTLSADEASAASTAFWETCGFVLAAADERYPVLRRELS